MLTDKISPTHTLADLAVTRSGAARVFHRHGLDFCCHGHVSLADTCAAKELDLDALVAEIEAAEASADEPFERWDEAAPELLIEHLLTRFHEEHRAELPRLIEMAEKVERVHADKETCPRGLTAHLRGMAVALEEHMQKEEQVLFPMIQAGRGRMAAMPIQMMELEHKDHGANLDQLRALAHDFEPPAEACTTWRALYDGLAALVRDLMQHIHLENNVLFPKALRG